ncbi:MAG: branched-chain-amino-acid transaminase [Mycobacterium leprae]
MGIQVYIDGQFYAKDEAKISVFDHGFLYGDGVFEGIRAYGGRIFKLSEHLDRLYASAKTINLEIPIPWAEMESVVRETCRRSNLLADSYIRLVVSRGTGDLGLDPRKCKRATVVCIADAISLYPPEVYTEGMKVISVSTRRTGVDSLSPQVKSLNYLNGIMAKISAITLGYPEVIMLNKEGYVCEGTGDNIFMVKNGKLVTPPTYLGVLPGITRATVMEAARSMGVPAEEGVFTLHDVYNADEMFLTGTAAEVVPVVMADGRPIGTGKPGSITARLIGRYREMCGNQGTPIA